MKHHLMSMQGWYQLLAGVAFKVWALLGIWYIMGIEGFQTRGLYKGPMVWVVESWSDPRILWRLC